MRLLLVGAGDVVSIGDVEDGYHAALREAGITVAYYDLSSRLDLVQKWLHRLWRARGKLPDQKPSWPDVIYRSSIEALEMALRFRVDWVLIISGIFFHPDVCTILRRAGVRTAVILTESPYEDAKQAGFARIVDQCWTNERTSVERLRLANSRVHYLPHAYDPGRHALFTPPLAEMAAHDVVFVGTGFKERIEVLEAVDWSGIDLGLYGEWSLLGSRSRLRQFIRGGRIPNEHTVGLYRRAKIGLNLHRTSVTRDRASMRIADAESMNPRAYELAACEVFTVSDYRLELDETLGEAVPTFTTPQQLEILLRTYLNHSPERRRLARLARERIQPHTFAARTTQLLSHLSVEQQSLAKGA